MARAHDDSSSLRFGRRESERLIVALVCSFLLHLVVILGYQSGEKLGWWQKWRLPAWLHAEAKIHHLVPPQPKRLQTTEPTVFVDVSRADADAPQRPKFYSNKNSHAANAEVAATDAPKINGRQTDMPKTEDVAKPLKGKGATAEQTPDKPKQETTPEESVPRPAQLQPSLPPPSQDLAQDEQKESPQSPGETDPLKPKKLSHATPPSPQQQPAQPNRPRTIKQALAQREQIPGLQTHQEGGVPRHAFTSSLDAKATPFGDYDAAIIEAISQRWYDLLDSRRFAQDRTGKVMLRFKLKSDGSVIEMETLDNTVGELLGYLCQEAIEEAAPFAAWPPDMVRMIGSNYRVVTFTFYYY